MKLKVFAIPATGDEAAEVALNTFTAKQRVIQIDRQLIQNGSASFWSICVGYSEVSSQSGKSRTSSRVDYRTILSPDDFRHYAALREWRKEVADREGIPAFGVFTNEQLAAIVRLPELTLTALLNIDGIGQKKSDQYGRAALELVQKRRSIDSDELPKQEISGTQPLPADTSESQ